MLRTIVVKMCDCAMDLADSMRSASADRAYWFFWKVRNTALGLGGDTEKPPCWYCLVGAENPNDPEDVSCQYCLSGELNPEAEQHWLKDDPLADSLGIDPDRLDNGRGGCDRPRWSVLPCGHCACRSACEGDGCAANKLWRDEQDSWCGCAQPGRNGVLNCGHCGCGYGCFEVVRNGSHAEMQKVPCG